MADWVKWAFDGIGAGIVIFVLGLLVVKQYNSMQRQRSGHNSTNIQAGRDITVGERRDRK